MEEELLKPWMDLDEHSRISEAEGIVDSWLEIERAREFLKWLESDRGEERYKKLMAFLENLKIKFGKW